MANYFPAQAKVLPSFTEPDLIVTYAQASGAFHVLAEGKPRVKIGSDDLFVYVNALDIRNRVHVAQTAGTLLPSASLAATMLSTPTYLLRTRTEWDHHDTAAASQYNVGLPAALDLAARQGHFQQGRVLVLYGYNGANGEGLMNASGAMATTLPKDSYGNGTVSSYDNGQLAIWILQQIALLKQSMYQSGGLSNRIVLLGPQRIFFQLDTAQIVQLVSYQRPGAGSRTVGGTIREVVEESGDRIEYVYDDTLIGKGSGGSDAVILTIPEIEVPSIPGIDTNQMGNFQPSMRDVNVMYADMAAPMKITTPIPDGGMTEIQEWRLTSGWNVRGAGVYILSMPH